METEYFERLQLILVVSQVTILALPTSTSLHLNIFGSSELIFICMQRIRELEDRIDLQRRQIKDIEEKVHIGLGKKILGILHIVMILFLY